MVDTNWPDFPDTSYVEETDILLALRGAGGVNIPGSAFVKKRSDGHVAIQRAGGGAQELILSLDAGSTGFGVRDTQIRAGNNGSNQTYLDFYTSNAAAPAHAMRIAANGSVGIGTTNPLWKFHILGAASDLAGIISTGTSSGLLIGDSTAAIRLGTRSGAFIVDVGAERMRIGTNGNIAIGNTDTSRTLNVYNADCWLQLKNATNGWLLGPGSSTNFGIYDNTNSGYRLVVLAAGGHTAPGGDNVYSLGTASLRWTTVFATNGTINTSDERAKQNIEAVPDEWLDAWGSVQWVRYKFKDAVEAKGDDARWHVGLVAQAVRDAFAARDLDAQAIGLLCYDQWEEQLEPIMEERQIDTEEVVVDRINTGLFDAHGEPVFRDVTEDRPIMGMVDTGETRVTLEAGDRWGLRYDECQAMEAAWQRRELARNSAISEERIAGLEAMNKLLSDRLAALEAA